MSDYDMVRDALTFASPTGDETHEALAALDRIEAENARLEKDLRQERLVSLKVHAESVYLRHIEEAARKVADDPYYQSKAVIALRTALEGGE